MEGSGYLRYGDAQDKEEERAEDKRNDRSEEVDPSGKGVAEVEEEVMG